MNSGAVTWRQRWRCSPLPDALLAVVLTVVLVSGTEGEAHPRAVPDTVQFPSHHVPHPPLAALLLVVLACLVLALRRRWPVTVLAVSTAAVVGFTLLGYVNGAAMLAPAFALYAAATRVSVRRAAGLAVLTMAALMAATAAANPFGHITGGGFDIIPALVAVAAFAGIAVASRRAFVASFKARADDEARRRIDEERLRIARELHDVVAHTMATINVHAGAALHVADERPEAATDALRIIRGASKDGLRELRAILNVLRQAGEPDSTMPAPGLAQLDALIASTQTAGVATTLTVTGNRRPLPSEVDLAAYRIVQESLTNVIRHAGAAAAAVSIGFGDGELAIEVTDTGRGTPPDAAASGGHGLAGMRERAVSVGGRLQAGPGRDGGFRVAARLPLGRPPAGGPASDGGSAAAAAAERPAGAAAAGPSERPAGTTGAGTTGAGAAGRPAPDPAQAGPGPAREGGSAASAAAPAAEGTRS